ncbi:MAG TPA: alpha-glucosidase, partial [Paracoccaceae bacterium]|nr:alpha-glucosidase [Paracoccaceae bacterium]
GDIPGIISKLDYLATLGVGFIWLSPVYKSPMADNGYDISDYQDIAPEFGTLADFDALLAEAEKRKIGIVMDLVVNHSSDEHAWFQNARSARDSEYRDFYIWRDPAPDGGAPNDLQSFFGGPAWTFDEATGQYYFHLFDPKQPDLNWENPKLRQAVYDMMNWWFDRGIAGFRMDVIDLIGKDPDRGITADGPRLHEYLREMNANTLQGRDVVTVGEAWSANTGNALLYSGHDSKELSMVFQFEHVSNGWDEKYGKWKPKPFDLVALKTIFNKWQEALSDDGWNSLFWGNHDLPRAVSKYGNDSTYRVESAKMLATVLHLMKGTPYVYQGEEIGMTNITFTDIGQFNDVEIHNNYRIQQERGLSEAEFLAGANSDGRDNARTPMQWDATENAGFTTGTPWLPVNPNYREINAAAVVDDPSSIYEHYRLLATIRRDVGTVVSGAYTPYLADHPDIFAYTRTDGGQRLAVVGSFSDQPVTFSIPKGLEIEGTCLISNYDGRENLSGEVTLQPYESFAIFSF